jgi:2,4-dienoyl-CoA reductase-like NADH-dependent reductase (Old Yellow Enzyme family)
MKQTFMPARVGRYTLPNRLVMAPMTRSRARADGTPGELAAEYYSQRATAAQGADKAVARVRVG